MSLLIDRSGLGNCRCSVRRALSLVLCAALLASVCPLFSSPAVTVHAQSTVDELNAQKDALALEQEQLAQQRDETAATLEEQQQQNEIIRQQIDAKSSEIAVNEQLLATLDTAIAEKTAAIAAQEATIASLEKEIESQQASLRMRLRSISKKSGVATFIQLILNSSNYTEYLIGFKVSEQISTMNEQLMQQLEQNIQTVEAARNQSKTDKAALEIERTQAAQIQTELENGKASLQALYNEANTLTDSMLQNVEYLDEQIAAIDAQQASLQGTIDAVMEQIRLEEEARRAEEERLRQEEEERLRQEEEEAQRREEEEAEEDSSSSEGSEDTSYEDDIDSDSDTGGEDSSDTESDSSDIESDSSDTESDSSDEDSDNDVTVGEMLWPAPTCRVITSSFKYREQFDRWHNGLDIACYGDAEGEPIVAAAAGQVRYANRYDEWGGGYGLFMMIDHGYDDEGRRIITVYAHCSEVLVYEGLEVEAGEVIGYIGDTGNSYGAHLHFEVQVDGTAVDPVSNGYVSTEWIDVLG